MVQLKIKNRLFHYVALLGGLLLFGCTLPGMSFNRGGNGQDIQSSRDTSYDGPKSRIAVAEFTDKTNANRSYQPAFGSGMHDMLVNALFNSGRYIVLERGNLQAVLNEQDLRVMGRVKKGIATVSGEIEGADLLVQAAITEFDPGSAGASGGGSSTSWLGLLSNMAGSFGMSHVAIDVRLIDAKTSRVVAATTVEGKAFNLGGSGGVTGNSALGSLSAFAKTPMEKAIRSCIDDAIAFIVTKTPESFYRYGKRPVTKTVSTTSTTKAHNQ